MVRFVAELPPCFSAPVRWAIELSPASGFSRNPGFPADAGWGFIPAGRTVVHAVGIEAEVSSAFNHPVWPLYTSLPGTPVDLRPIDAYTVASALVGNTRIIDAPHILQIDPADARA